MVAIAGRNRRLESLNAAITSAHATATGAGSFSTGTDRNNLSKDTVAKISESTTAIVANVVNKGHLTDECINLMTVYAQSALKTDEQITATLELCEAVIATDLLVYQQVLAAHPGQAPPPPAL